MEKISSDILALLSEAAVIVKAGKISFANNSAKELLGQDCIGKRAVGIFGPDVIGCQSSSFIAGINLGSRPCTIRASKMDSAQLIFIAPTNKPDSILNEPFLCTMRNSLMSLELVANSMRSKAEESHDSELLKDVATLSKHYYRMTRLINNASFALSEDDTLTDLSTAPVNLTSLYSDLLASFSFFVKDIELNAELGEDIIVNCNAVLAQKLLLNLISNCLIHAKGCTKITVYLINTTESVILSVSDNGCGIASSDLHTVFERYRYSFSLSDMGKGAGLGLTISRRIARMHGGTLLLESREGIGTTVRASMAKTHSSACSLHCHCPEQDSTRDMIQLELSDYLSQEFYSEKYMD